MVTHSTLLAGKSHRQRNLAGYSPWGCRVRLRTYTFAFVEICAKETMTNKAKMCSVTQSCLTLLPFGLEPSKLLCPWDFPGKNTGVGCHFFLQGIFLTQGWNWHLLHWQGNSLPLSHLGNNIMGNNIMLLIHSVMFDSLQPHGLQHTRPPCPLPSPGVCSNSYPLSR